MDVFWSHGYERASVQNLLDGMGINRGSMYDTFGDKHALFVDAVEHYCDTVMQKAFDLLATPGSPLGTYAVCSGSWSSTRRGSTPAAA